MQKSVILYSVFDWRGRQNAEDAIGQAAQSPELRQPKRSAELHPCRPRCGERHGGVITASRDERHGTVLELFPESLRRGLFAVGRLDKDTEGLLLVTDDGALSHALMSPSRHVSKVYEAEFDGMLVPDAAERFGAGLTLRDGTVCRPALLELLPDGRVRVTLHEGKYHQVKRMIAACGATVTFLKRVQLGGVRLDESLAPGEFRELTEEELGALRPPDGL